MAVCCNRKHCFCQSVLTCKEIILTPIWGDLYNNIIYVCLMVMLFWKKDIMKICSNRMSVDLCDRNQFGISPHFHYERFFCLCTLWNTLCHITKMTSIWAILSESNCKIAYQNQKKMNGESKNGMTTTTEWLNVL